MDAHGLLHVPALGFYLRAALAAMLASLTLSMLSGFVVLKRLAFAGSGIAHAAFGGVALALLLHLPPLPVAVVFSLALGLLVDNLSRDGGLPEDSAIGIFFAASMALGVLLLSLRKSYNVDLFSLLFGNLLAVSAPDLWMMGGLAVLTALLLWRYTGAMMSVAFDEDLATVSGLPVKALSRLLLLLLTLAIILSMKAVGVVLVSALLVLPGASSLEVAWSLRSFFTLAVCFGLLAAAAGIGVSFALNLASGSAIVLVGTVIFLLLNLRRRRQSR